MQSIISQTAAGTSWISPDAVQNSDLFKGHGKEHGLEISLSASTALGIALGILFTTLNLEVIAPEFYEKSISGCEVTLSDPVNAPETPKEEPVQQTSTPKEKSERKTLSSSASASSSAPSGRGNSVDPTKTGVLALLKHSGAISSTNSAIFGSGGFAEGVDKVLAGVQGIAKGDGGGTGRRGEGELFGDGNGKVPGFGNGSGGLSDVNALMNSLMDGGGTRITMKDRTIKQRVIKDPEGAGSSAISGKRSRADIMRVVSQNMQSLRYLFNRHLRENPGLKGKITLKWAIDEFGNVLFCTVQSSTISSDAFQQEIVEAVKQWRFSTFEVSGDVTEVIYPFVFTQ